MNRKLFLCVTFALICDVYSQEYNARPKILTKDGNLIISAGFDRNITIKTTGPKSYIKLEKSNKAHILSSTAKLSPARNDNERVDVTEDKKINEILQRQRGVLNRLHILELKTRNYSTSHVSLSKGQSNLEQEITEIKNFLIKDDCLSSPCVNRGECRDLYDGYTCRCPSNWEGENCDVDVNECTRFAGTDLGCQNGATCNNKPGSYECQCSAGWYGRHCVRRAFNCSGHDSEICGNGVCMPISSGVGIKCFCDPGWKTDGVRPDCSVDVDECNQKKYPCSINPRVQCMNSLGSYTCGNCPMGYEGDGYTCSDIDECQMNNGGCSITPNVQCMNTLGSRMCGPCPPGYQGNGELCTRVTSHTGETENPRTSQCQPNPCGVHGTCHMTSRGYTCICQDGYQGSDCSKLKHVCADSPCKNGGVCREDNSVSFGYRCECGAQYTGAECQERAQACEDFHNTSEGDIVYPLSNSSLYGYNTLCTWVIQTSPDKVLNVTFTRFHFDNSTDCDNNWLEIHDGRSSGSHSFGRYCGNILPKGGKIISSHSSLYFSLKSDHSVAANEFSLHWESVDPICGGLVDALSPGSINSPGSPGPYPPNRDCYWTLTAKPGKQIQLHFFLVELAAHHNCSFDYIEISNGYPPNPIIQKYCDSTQPPPYTSAGPTLWIHFHSDSHANSARGFQISYASTEGIPGCGGIYTTDKGELTPPTFKGRYHDNLDCEYKIQAHINNIIKITFLKFELEQHGDYLSVYDGGSTNSKFVGKYSGDIIPPPYTSSSNEMLLVFKTDWDTGYSGFKVEYETVCHMTFTEEQGVISSQGYPKPYPNSTKCKYLVRVALGKALELRFNDFDVDFSDYEDYEETETTCDNGDLSIYDGDSVNSPKIGKYCGTDTPPLILSTHNYIYLAFQSNSNFRSRRGFSINYTTVDTGCGGIFKDYTGIISYPNLTENKLEITNYDESKNCSWILSAPIGFVIQLTWRTFNVELTESCRADSVKLFDVDSDTGDVQLIESYCGDQPPPTLTSTSNILMINFTSDDTVSKSRFTLSYIYVSIKSLCEGHFRSSRGVLTSPGWPDSYPRNQDCEWTITLPLGQQIFLKFTNFSFERKWQKKCKSDWLEIRNGGDKRAPVIGIYCGSTIPKSITTLGNALYIRFKSDNSLQLAGFRLEWHETVTGCGGSLISSEGSLSSPNYPDPYGKNSECYWRITTNAGSAIEINFTDIDLDKDSNCKNHYIEFYDGRDNSASKIGTYCLIRSVPKIISSSNHMFVKYRSVIDMERKGFAFNYSTVCHRNISGFSGVIESLDFQNEYPKSLNCTWYLTAPKGSIIDVTFMDFDFNLFPKHPIYNYRMQPRYYIEDSSLIHCSQDYIMLQDGFYTNYTIRLCGRTRPEQFSTKSNKLKINYASTSADKSRFKLEWRAQGCGGVLRRAKGEFLPTPNKGETSTELECHWKIIADPGTSIELTISELHMDAVPDCPLEYILVYNGPNEESPILSKMCHLQKKYITVTSSSNYMYIVFKAKLFNHRTSSNFTGEYTSTTSRCGGKFVGDNGVIISPNYPNNYDRNLDCFWTIEVEQNHLIELNFSVFDIIDNKGICSDYVKIYDGVDPADGGMNLTKYCGSKDPFSVTFASKTNKITIQLKTDDGKIKAKGFKLNYQIACGARIITDGEGFLSNIPGLSNIKYNNCTWTILAKELNQRVYVTFKHFDIKKYSECKINYINIFDGDDVDAPLIGKYCGRKVPPTIVSRGSAVTIQIGSDLEGMISGRFSAHYSVLSTACGGVLTSESGSLTSPYYPDTYPFSSDCEWTLQTSPGNKLSMSFEKLDIESSENCNEDYIEIRENGGTGQLLGVFCGNKVPSKELVGSQVYVKFRSDDKGTASGFVLHFSFVHEIEITNLTHGTISSPLHPELFIFDGVYSWMVSTKLQTVIDVTIQEVYIYDKWEKCENYITLYDGVNDVAPVLFTSCENNMLPKSVRSTSDKLYIKLYLDPLNKGSKFLLEWREISIDKTIVEDSKNIICNSNNTIHILEGESFDLTSPGYPEHYDNDMECEWIFSTEEGNHLSIYFSKIDLMQSNGCYEDKINVFEQVNGKWKALSGNICFWNGTNNDKFEINGLMKVTFASSYNHLRKKGFFAVVRSECGGHLTQHSYLLKGSGIGITCIWTVRVRPERTIHLYVKMITRDIDTCDSYLILRDGNMADSPLLQKNKYCQHDFRFMEFHTKTNKLYVKYVTSKNRFAENALIIQYSEISEECGFTMSLTDEMNSTTIYSPNFPNSPPSFSECIWVITAPAGEILQLDVIDRFDLTFDSACSKERLEIRDGGTKNSDLIGVFCKKIPSTQKTTGNMLFVRFITNLDEPKDGFKARITIGTCGGTMRVEGRFTSPGYPSISNLLPGTLCEWRLIGLPHQELFINLVDLQLPPSEILCGTNLTFYNILPSNRSLVLLSGPLCNNSQNPATINSWSNEVVVRFQKDFAPHTTLWHDTTHTGFSLNFSSATSHCSYEMNEPSGFLESPGYPYRLRSSFHCNWIITVPPGRRVTLQILDFNIYRSNLIIQDSHTSFPLTNNAEPRILKSTGREMFVNYHGDQAFKAKYTSDEPTVCQGSLSQINGTIYLPAEDSFFCEWVRAASGDKLTSNATILFKFSNLTKVSSEMCDSVMTSTITLRDNIISNKILVCGNYSSNSIEFRYPDTALTLRVNRLPDSSLSFKLDYTSQPCGGVIKVTAGNSWISLPRNHKGSLDCAWSFRNPDRREVNIKTEGGLDSNCDKEYFKISDLDTTPKPIEIRKYCKHEMHSDILKLTFENFLMEYHTDLFSNKSNLIVKIFMKDSERKRCGGTLSGNTQTLQTPNFPKSYGFNEECIWDIVAETGYRITLTFEKRFNVEETHNCSKDYVLVYDYVNYDYVPNTKLCGRILPPRVNSTSNELRVVFRSDDSVNSDGFQAVLTTYCGGSYEAMEQEQRLYTPSIKFNQKLDECVYTITAKNKYILIKFPPSHDRTFTRISEDHNCIYNKFTFVEEYYTKQRTEYCRNDLPKTLRFQHSVTIYYTNSYRYTYVDLINYYFDFVIDHCNEEITQPGQIRYPRDKERTFDTYLDCRWNITAPDDKIIILKIVHLIGICVQIYDGTDKDQLITDLCGPSNNLLRVIHSKTNKMSVHFATDNDAQQSSSEGFVADIVFMYSEQRGCGGNKDVQLNSTLQITSPVVGNTDQYVPFLDCYSLIKATADQVLLVTFQKMKIAPCSSLNSSNLTSLGSNDNCTCDFVELRDGDSSGANLLARYCGYIFPPDIVTSTRYLYVRFVSDALVEDLGYQAAVTATYTRCGEQNFKATQTLQRIVPPRDDKGAILRSLNCKYEIDTNDDKMVRVHVKSIDLEPPSTEDNICHNDRFEMKNVFSNNEGNWDNFEGEYSQSSMVTPGQLYTICGAVNNLTFYITKKMYFQVLTATDIPSQHYSGYELEISIAEMCDMIYMDPQNRITFDKTQFNTCTFLIEAPQNYTISLYLSSLQIWGRYSFIDVIDGKSTNSTNKRLQHYDLYSDSSKQAAAVFSTGRYMLIQMKINGLTKLDMYYVTTKEGRGCGGKLYTYDGIFTSPMYPAPYRKQAVCEWIVETPPGTRLKLKIPKFDLGHRQLCNRDYLELMNRAGKSIVKYCADDEPADHTSEDNYMKVIYHSSVNGGGPGWKAQFTSTSYQRI